jgi:hypothetical protein
MFLIVCVPCRGSRDVSGILRVIEFDAKSIGVMCAENINIFNVSEAISFVSCSLHRNLQWRPTANGRNATIRSINLCQGICSNLSSWLNIRENTTNLSSYSRSLSGVNDHYRHYRIRRTVLHCSGVRSAKDARSFDLAHHSLVTFQSEPADNDKTIGEKHERKISHLQVITEPFWRPTL